MKLRGKFNIWIILFGLFPALIIGSYYSYHSEQTVQNKVIGMAEASSRNKAVAINDRIAYVEQTLSTAILNDSIGEMLYTMPEQDTVEQIMTEKKIQKHFSSIVYNNEYVNSILLIPNNSQNKMYGHGATGSQSENFQYFLNGDFESSREYDNLINKKNSAIWKTITIDNNDYLCLMRNFNYFLLGKPLGVIIFVITPEMLGDYTMSNTQEMNTTIWNLTDATSEERIEFSANGRNPTISENDSTFLITTPLISQWVYQEEIYKAFLFDELSVVRNNMILFIVITSFVFLFISFLMSHWMGQRVQVLVNKFKRLEKGDFQIDTALSGNDELGIIEQEYNKMVSQLKVTIDENYLYQTEKKKAELSALQYQINPHFLYNTLESIQAMVNLNLQSQAQEMIQKLSQMYRYNMSSSNQELVTFYEELAHVESYVYIQNIQMSNHLNLFIDVSEELLSQPVLRFLLQPIIENSIKHGFTDPNKHYSIEICAAINDNGMQIVIIDDGDGISADILNHLQASLSTDKPSSDNAGGIGLINVSQRIRLFYGDEHKLVVKSKKGQGTTIVLNLSIEENVYGNSIGS